MIIRDFVHNERQAPDENHREHRNITHEQKTVMTKDIITHAAERQHVIQDLSFKINVVTDDADQQVDQVATPSKAASR